MIPKAVVSMLLLTTLVLCVKSSVDKMITSNMTTTAPSRGVWAENNLYDIPLLILSQRQASNMTSSPLKTPDTEQPLNDGQTRQRTGESRRSVHKTVAPGRCIYYSDLLQCWAWQESWGLNWLRLAREYNSSFDYDFPDTCRYTSMSFWCTIPLPGHLATILRTLSFYDLRYQSKMADRGPYGLHLDFLMDLNDVVTLMDLFSAESALNFQQ